MIKKTLLFLVLVSFSSTLMAQKRECASHEIHLESLAKDVKYAERIAQIEAFTAEFIENYDPITSLNSVVSIPVVFHIVHDGDAVGSGENVSDALVQAQLQQLNDDFRKQNSDIGSVPSAFSGIAADLEIEFCLATQDPNGNATNGINRVDGGRTSWTTNQIESDLKPNTIWDRDSYLNFWSVRFGGSSSNLLGYAQFPGGAANTDGVVCLYSTLGSLASPNPAGGSFARGRTGTHEVGHWLNLRHIWGDDGGSCNGSDLVNDTPNQANFYTGTPSYPQNSCNSSDMFMNYMDYVNDNAMYMFSEGQKTRALAAITSFRPSLTTSSGCGTPTPPTCDDGIQNGDETGVDCGGPDCDPCSTGCDDNEVTITIQLDNYPEETSWTLVNDSGQSIASGGTYGSQPDGSTVTETLCLPDDCYTFTINDSYGDGICCRYGSGSYSVTGASGTLASGGSFGSSESTNFCLNSTPPPTCDDGIQNGDETGIDCGGPDCDPCEVPPTCDDGIQNGDETGVDCGGPDCDPCEVPPTCDDGIQNGDETGVDCGGPDCDPCTTGGTTVLHEGYFESGWDGWIDGGSDCYRYSGFRSYEGDYSIRIRDNSGSQSAMTLNNLNTSGYDQVQIEFYFYSGSMENGEDFWVRFNDGSGWETVASYARGTSFENNNFYVATVTLDANDYNFGSGTDFRFQCDASANNDQIYIDQVTISGINGSVDRINTIEKLDINMVDRSIIEEEEMTTMVYPNPARDFLTVSAPEMDIDEGKTSFRILSSIGKIVSTGELIGNQVNVSNLPAGLYVLILTNGDEKESIKFIKQ